MPRTPILRRAGAFWLFPVVLAAQQPCFDTALGTRLTMGDDTVAPNQQLGFAFPGPGGAVTTAITVTSNGFVWLTGNATSSDCCNVSAANLVGGAPRIAPYWVDLNPAAGGGVYFRAVPASGGDPARAVITWSNVPEYGTQNPVTVQLQLVADGSLLFGYEGPIRTDQHQVLAGVSQGNGAAQNPADLSQLFLGGVRDTGTSATLHEVFGNDTFDLTGHVLVFTPNGIGGYAVRERTPCRRAAWSSFGRGCPSLPIVYEAFAPGTIDLAGRGLRFQPNGAGGFTVSLLAGAPILPTQNVIAVADDSVVRCTLPFSWSHPGGTTQAVDVSTNGIATLVAGAVQHARCCEGIAAAFVAGPASIAALWQDLDPPSGGAVFWDVEVGGQRAWATWLDCPEFGNSAVRNTAQLVFEAGGAFELRYGVLANAAHRCLVGYTPGGAGDPGSLDFTLQLPFSTGSAGTPLLLRAVADARPILGVTWPAAVSGIPAGSPLGFLVVGFTRAQPPVALAPIGMPDCFQYVTADATRAFAVGGPIAYTGLPVPADPALAGLPVYAQAAVVAAGANALGMLATDAVELLLGR